MSETQQGRGGARPGAGRKPKTPGIKRQSTTWHVEEWIPQALQELAQEYGVDSTSDIVNEALKSVCLLHGKSPSWESADPSQTSRWRFFPDDELTEVLEALRTRFHAQKEDADTPLRRVWLSAWQALEPQADQPNHRPSVLKTKQEIK